jgi:pyrroloquinoline quinone (PQQ) biosynthesis protein C
VTHKSPSVIPLLDELVHEYVRRTRFFHEPITMGRARMWVMQHRLNTRQRNSVLKLRVATNCPDWDTRLQIIEACADEVIADEKYGHGKPHWQHLEELGVSLGMRLEDVQNARPLDSTLLCWSAWDGLMSNTHWLEGVIANTCAERPNVPGYGMGAYREHGRSGAERKRWREAFRLNEDQLVWFAMHEAADLEHSNAGWNTIARYAKALHMEDAVVEACRKNLLVWTLYFDGIREAGDALEHTLQHKS